MKPEQIVPDLELCKKMKDLGIGFKKPFFVWVSDYNKVMVNDIRMSKNDYPAPTVAEMGEIFSKKNLGRNNPSSWYNFTKNLWHCAIYDYKQMYSDKKEANARAKMLIWLKEEKYI